MDIILMSIVENCKDQILNRLNDLEKKLDQILIYIENEMKNGQ